MYGRNTAPTSHRWWSCLKFKFSNSLRSYYLLGAAVLAVLVLASALLAHKYVTDVRQQSIVNLEERNHLLEYSRILRDSFWQSDELLGMFLLDPGNPEYQKDIFKWLDKAIENSRHLNAYGWIADNNQAEIISELAVSLQQLKNSIRELIKTRIDPEKQYPTFVITRDDMLPNHQKFSTANSLAVDEVIDEGISGKANRETYLALMQARSTWTDMISGFRVYLANQVGAFSPSTLGSQENDIETIHRELLEQLSRLSERDDAGQLGFQTSVSVEEMKQASIDWHKAFQRVKRIHATDEWRADSKILTETVFPLYEEIWGLLVSFDIALESSAQEDVTSLSKLAKKQVIMLWLLTALGMLFIAAGFILLERMILRPISVVVGALNAKARGTENIPLPEAASMETQELLNAFSEMSSQVNARQVELEHQALHDSLTGLPNRTLLSDRLQQAIFTARRGHKQLALIMMDLDGFKEVNDTVGHLFGDSLLKEVGSRLIKAMRDMDTVARLGGDEFAILLPDSDEARARSVAEKIKNTLEQVFLIGDLRLHISASIGITTYPLHGTSAEALLQRADIAMYVAKRKKTGHIVYDPKKDKHSVGKLALLSDLRNALEFDELELHYQPKVNISTNEVVGVEALLRWNHTRLGPIPPDEIVKLSEQTGLIQNLSLWVLNSAIKQMEIWQRNNIPLGIAINISVHNLRDMEFVEELEQNLRRHNLASHTLNLEITESAMMSNPERAIDILSKLHAMGVKLSIDDYGTGFSSLAYLKQLPVDELKIDKSFVINMTEDENDAVIVRSTIDLAHNLGLKVVAEGVETLDALNLLEILGCDLAQGYYLAKPMPSEALEKWLFNRMDQKRDSNVFMFVK